MSEGFASTVESSGVSSRNALGRNHHPTSATVVEVERDFGQLARQWIANACEPSQNASVLAAYLAVPDDHRALLFTVYDVHE